MCLAGTLDAHVELKQYYECSCDGSWLSPKERPAELQSVKSCPDCRVPITNVRRYGRVINRAMLDNMTRKFLVHGTRELGLIHDELSMAMQDPKLNEAKADARVCLMKKLEEIVHRCAKISSWRQPLRAIRDACTAHQARSDFPSVCSLDVPPPDNTLMFEASLLAAEAKILQLQCACLSARKKEAQKCNKLDLDSVEETFEAAFEDLKSLASMAEDEGRKMTLRKAHLAAGRLAQRRAKCLLEWALSSKKGSVLVNDELIESLLGDTNGVGFCLRMYGGAMACNDEERSELIDCAATLAIALRVKQRRAGSSQEAFAQTCALFDRAMSIVDNAVQYGGESFYDKALRVRIVILANRASYLRTVDTQKAEGERLLNHAHGLLEELPLTEREEAEADIARALTLETFYDEVSKDEKLMIYKAMGHLQNNRTSGMGNHWWVTSQSISSLFIIFRRHMISGLCFMRSVTLRLCSPVLLQ